MAETIKANAEAMQKTPYSTYAVRTNAKPPPAYNFENPEYGPVSPPSAPGATLQKTFRANDGTGPVSVFEGKEGEAFANTLTNGDPARPRNRWRGWPPAGRYLSGHAGAEAGREAVAGMMGARTRRACRPP
jgi:hypothetical protein